MGVRAAFRVPRRAGILVCWLAVPLFACCTSVLGIDGEYRLGREGGSGPSISPEPDGGGAGGAGGVLQSSGGASSGGSTASGGSGTGGADDGSSAGGVSAGGSAGQIQDAAPPPPPNCRPGLYTGTWNGEHQPAITVVGVPLQVVGGKISLRLSGSGTTLDVVDGKLESSFAWGTLGGTFSGKYDCGTGLLDATLSGQLNVIPAVTTISGSLSGRIVGGNSNTNTWKEHEPTFDASTGTGTGKGDWSVAYAGQ
jgi:hypothetical protein